MLRGKWRRQFREEQFALKLLTSTRTRCDCSRLTSLAVALVPRTTVSLAILSPRQVGPIFALVSIRLTLVSRAGSVNRCIERPMVTAKRL